MSNVADWRGCVAPSQAVVLSHRVVHAGTNIMSLSLGCDVSETDDLLWCGRLGSLMGRTFHRETCPCRVSPDVRAIMMILRVHVVEFLCQVVMGRTPVLKCLVLGVCVGACGYVLSCQALYGTTLQGPDCSGVYPIFDSPRV
jgi:hypothetical protein